MKVVQRIADLPRPIHGQAFVGQVPLLDPRPQIVAIDIIHDKVLALSGDDKVVGDAGKVGMAQAGQDGGFAPELTGVFLRCEEVFLDRDRNPEVFVEGFVNRTHPTAAQD